MRLLLVFLAAAAACGCGYPDDNHLDVVYDVCAPLQVVAPGDASEAEIAALDDAIAYWRAVGIDRLTRAQDLDGEPVVQQIPLHFDRAAPMFHGVYDDEAGVVIINREMGGGHDALAITIAHELGHAFGLWHVHGRSSVMNPGNAHLLPNAQDVADIMAIWGPCTSP